MSTIYISKLVNGLIPKNTICPFKKNCESIENCPGESIMDIDFSCASARGFDVIYRLSNKTRKLKVIQDED